MVSLSLFDQVLQTLVQDVQQHRIKKLLICNCYGIWEDDLAKLQDISWRKLLQDTLERSPTLESLNLQLNQVAKTLSKPVEYAHVANQTIAILEELYQVPPPPLPITPGSEECTQWFSAPDFTQFNPPIVYAPAVSPPNPYDLALQQLAEHPDETRLKKLAYCLCYNQWPGDDRQLAAVNWAQMVQILLDLIPTPDHLYYLIHQVAQSLSKPQEYVALGQNLWQIVFPLYGLSAPSPRSFGALGTETIAPPETELPYSVPYSASQNASMDNPVVHAPPQIPDPSPAYDRFGIRSELMKYTNPFMAKVLLFSIIYRPFDLNSKDWSQLNQSDLDSLVEVVLARFPAAQDLKQQLMNLANIVVPKELAQQAAGTIFRVLKPYCQTQTSGVPESGARRSSNGEGIATAPSLEEIFGNVSEPNPETRREGSTIPLFNRGQV